MLTYMCTGGWFKIASDGLGSDGKWGVDRLIANGGVQTITIPQCIAPGQYLLRGELIALHAASSSGGAQLYMVSQLKKFATRSRREGEEIADMSVGMRPDQRAGWVREQDTGDGELPWGVQGERCGDFVQFVQWAEDVYCSGAIGVYVLDWRGRR